jgi:hypothetical protein
MPANPVRGGRGMGRPVGHGDQRRVGLTAHVAEKLGVEWPEAVGVPKLGLVCGLDALLSTTEKGYPAGGGPAPG